MMDATNSGPPGGPGGELPQGAREQLELDHLRAQNANLLLVNQKLALELGKLQKPPDWATRVKQYLPLITAALAVAGFWGGIWSYIAAEHERAAELGKAAAHERQQAADAEKARLEQQKRADAAFRSSLLRETARPLWEKRLALYIEAADVAATIATAEPGGPARKKAETRFWVLYYGPLAAVEDTNPVIIDPVKREEWTVAKAMVKFGDALHENPNKPTPSELRDLALDLARVIRASLMPWFLESKGGPSSAPGGQP
jgi:hypothetical protein